jgi:hypothetical protein
MNKTDIYSVQVRKYCGLDDSFQALMKTVMRQLQLTT